MQIDRFVCIVIFFIVNCDSHTSPKSVHKPSFEIAVLLPLTEAAASEYWVSTKCSKKLHPSSLQTVEAFYYALDLVERDEELSQHFTMKIHIVENCGSPVADMLHFSRLLQELYMENKTIIKLRTESSNFENYTSSPYLIGVVYSNQYTKLEYDRIFSTIPEFPYISFSASSKQIFNPTELGENVILVSSGHLLVINVIFKILAYHDWKHVLFIASDNTGDKGSFWTYVKALAALESVCISQTLSMNIVQDMAHHHTFNEDRPQEYLRKRIPSYDTLDVIICYCDLQDLRLLQSALALAGKNARKILVIARNPDANENWRTLEWETKLADLFYVTPTPQYVDEFYNYYTSLSRDDDTKHEYLKTFRKRFFECPDDRQVYDEPCYDTYKDTYRNNSQASNIIKTVHVIAHAVNNIFHNQNPWILLGSEIPLEPFRKYVSQQINHVKFKLFDTEVSFTARGLPQTEKFDVYKSQATKNVLSNEFIKVAEYFKYGDSDDNSEDIYYTVSPFEIKGNLTILNDSFYKPRNYVKSSCSMPCDPGYIKKPQIDQCCWECDSCGVFEKLNVDGTSCVECQSGFLSDENKKICIPEPIRIPSKWYDGQNLISTCFSSCSIILTIITSIVFVKYRNTPVVKSTTEELCYVMFAGIILANIAVLISVLSYTFKTSEGKVLPAIGFCMIYSALLMKTKSQNAFPRIKPKLVSLRPKIILTIVLIGLETLICWHSVQANETKQVIEKNGVNLFLIKHYLDGFFLMKIFSFVVVLVLLCVYFAIKMRHLPGNYDETTYIAFTMYATIPTLLFFGLIYLISEYKILAVNLAISINSLIVLVFLFLPKLNIIFRRPEQNTKAYYATITPSIRKHQGNDAVEEINQ
ncbi:metabotropic glutamate receptor 1-like [Planococcus citri]|uniref:metabotropic glutamate receptor 1-like n=1 Tax=Planococcus citri TaxID=170843 RepID=UPI0031F85E5F